MPNPAPSNRLSPMTNIYFLSSSFGLVTVFCRTKVLYCTLVHQVSRLGGILLHRGNIKCRLSGQNIMSYKCLILLWKSFEVKIWFDYLDYLDFLECLEIQKILIVDLY